MPFDLGMEVSNITNKQQYGEEWCFRESKKAKVLNKVLGNIQKTKKKKKEKSCLSLDSEKQTDPTELNGDTGVTASLGFFAMWTKQLLDSWLFCHKTIITGLSRL